MSVVAASQEIQANKNRFQSLRIYLWILSFVKPYYPSAIMLVVSGILVSACELFIPKFIQYYIDNIYPTRDYRMFYVTCGVLGLMIVIVILSTMAQTILQRNLSEKAARDLRFSIFRKTRELGVSYYESHPIGHTLSLLNNEVTAIQEIYKSYMPTIIQFAIYSILSLVVMITINIKLALLMIPVFILYYLIGPYFARKAVDNGKLTAGYSIDLNKRVYDSVSALREYRANGSHKWDLARHSEHVDRYLKSYLRTNLYSSLRGSVRRLCNNVGALGIFAYGAVLTRDEELTVGGFVVFILIYFYTIFVLTKIISLAAEQQQLMFQGGLLYNFCQQEPLVKESAAPVTLNEIKGSLTFKNVSFGYQKGKEILQGFNLEVRAGEKIALVGTSGSGKSTLLKLAVRFYDPLQGSIELDGVPIVNLSLGQLRESIGCVFQETYLFGKSIQENIAFGNPDATEESIIAAAKAANAHSFISELPDGYHTIVGERGIKLSGGQRQRISIARMYVKNPTIILLDEATSALDNVTEREVQHALDNLMHGRTTIIVAHRLSTIRNADCIYVLDDGKIVESGSFEQLLDLRGKFHQLVKGDMYD